jgi:hypothetical protein
MRKAWLWVAIAAPLALGMFAFSIWSGLRVVPLVYEGIAAKWRSSAISAGVNECMEESKAEPTLKDVFNDDQLVDYCKCFANDYFDRLSMFDIFTLLVMKPTSRTEAKLEAVATACVARVKG